MSRMTQCCINPEATPYAGSHGREERRPAHVQPPRATYLGPQEAIMLILMVLMLTAEPEPVKASGVETAMFQIKSGGFTPVQSNEALKAILATKPALDLFETAALGSSAEFRRRLDADRNAVKAFNHFGWTALHFAAFAGNVDNARLLIERGADLNIRAKTRFRNTPLQAALLTGEYGTAKLLLERGADALVRQNKGFTPMHEAASLGRQDLIELLLEHGAELNSRSDDGRSPYSEALRAKRTETAEWLKSKGAVTEPMTTDLMASPD
jgi:hypothetical protein